MQSMLHRVKSMCFIEKEKEKRKSQPNVCVDKVMRKTNKSAYHAKQGVTRVIPLITYLVTALFAGTCMAF